MSETLVRNLETMKYKTLKINYTWLHIPYTKRWTVKSQGKDQRKKRRKGAGWRGEEEKRRRMEEGIRRRCRRGQSGGGKGGGVRKRGKRKEGRVALPVLLAF